MKLKIIKSDEIRHKILVFITNIFIFIVMPLLTVLLYLFRDIPTSSFIWQDYVISFILYFSPIAQCVVIRYNRNNKLRIEQRKYNELIGKWNAVAKVTQEDISDDLKQEVHNLKLKVALLEEQVTKHDASIDNQSLKLDTLIRY